MAAAARQRGAEDGADLRQNRSRDALGAANKANTRLPAMTGSQTTMEQVQVQVQAILARSLPVIEQQPISTPRLTCNPVPAPRKALVSLASSLLLRRLSTSAPAQCSAMVYYLGPCLGLRDRCRSYARLTARLCAGLCPEPEATAGPSGVGAEEWEAAGNRGRGACTKGIVKRTHSSIEGTHSTFLWRGRRRSPELPANSCLRTQHHSPDPYPSLAP